MRRPYERFLRFLTSRKVEVNPVLARMGLPPVGGLWAAECRTSFRTSTTPPAILHYLDTPEAIWPLRDGILEWASTEGFAELWQATPEFSGRQSKALDVALRIFTNPHARTRLGMFLFSELPLANLVENLDGHFDAEISLETLELYRRVFWDTDNMSRNDWDELLPTLKREERHYLALGINNPTMDGVRCALGLKYALEPDAVLRRLMVSSIEQYDELMKDPVPSIEALRWGEMAKTAAVALAQHIPKKSIETGIPTDFGNMFTVQISKSAHISLADLQGQVGIPAPAKKEEEGA